MIPCLRCMKNHNNPTENLAKVNIKMLNLGNVTRNLFQSSLFNKSKFFTPCFSLA